MENKDIKKQRIEFVLDENEKMHIEVNIRGLNNKLIFINALSQAITQIADGSITQNNLLVNSILQAKEEDFDLDSLKEIVKMFNNKK